MNRQIVIVAAAFMLVLGVQSPVIAQGGGGQGGGQPGGMIENVQSELERTDKVIEQAREMVHAANSAKAELALQTAVRLQEMAWDQFRLGTLSGLKEAAILTRQAREKAKYAIANGPLTEQNDDVVLRRLERTSDELETVKERVRTSGSHSWMASIDSAEDNLDRAWEFYRAGQQRPALKLCNQVDNTIRQIMSAVRRRTDDDRYEQQSSHVRELVIRAREQLTDCGLGGGPELVDQAEIALESADNLFADGNPDAAMKSLLRARELASQVIRDCTGFESLQQRYDQLLSRAQSYREEIPADNVNGQKLLDQAFDQLNLARGYIANQETDMAAASLKAAHLTLNLVGKTLEKTTSN